MVKSFNCGETIENFDEKNFYQNIKNIIIMIFKVLRGHLSIHKDIWNDVGGFSEEFYPGTGSDPDLNMKLWNLGVRIFKGINDFKVYHFGSIVTRKYKGDPKIKTESGSRGGKIFLLKWGLSINFFKKYFLKSETLYKDKLDEPNKNILFYINFILCKINYMYIKYVYNYKNKNNLFKKNEFN